MRIILCDVNREIVDAWLNEFDNYSSHWVDVRVNLGRFQDLKEEHLIMTAAGNSYGIMGGGIDLQIARFFPESELRVQQSIDEIHFGELSVGSSIYIVLDWNEQWIGLIYSPTMRAPSVIAGTDNVYKAMYSTLATYYPIQKMYDYRLKPTLIIPGFGGACGMVPPKSIARQMRLAIDNFFGRRRQKLNHQRMNFLNVQILEASKLR